MTKLHCKSDSFNPASRVDLKLKFHQSVETPANFNCTLSECGKYFLYHANKQSNFPHRPSFAPPGRHRCIGENFAYVQIKTIWSTLLRLFQFDLVDGYFPTINYTTMIHTPHRPVIRYKRRLQ